MPQLPQRLPAPGAGHPGRDDRAADPEAAGRVVPSRRSRAPPRAERALAWVVAARYLLGALTRRAGKLAVSLGRPPGPITSDVPRSRPMVEKSEEGNGRPPGPITSDVPRSRPMVEKSVSAGQMIQEPSPAGGR